MTNWVTSSQSVREVGFWLYGFGWYDDSRSPQKNAGRIIHDLPYARLFGVEIPCMPKSVFSTHVRMYGHKDPEDILELSKIHPCIIYHITLSIFLTLKHYGIDYGIETFGELEREFSSWTIETIETLLTLNPQHLEKTIPPLDSLLMTS